MEPFRILVPATDENFDETAYLAANRDVAHAVASGGLPSGRVHFEAFGALERRCLRRSVPLELKSHKLERVRALITPGTLVAEMPTLLDCLPEATRAELHLDPTDNVSSHEYDAFALDLITKHHDGLVLDCGAGLRNTYYPNVVNYEIVAYDSTDVLGAAERLPFEDASFDAVLSLNVVEHVRDPFQAAREIIRVMKPGAQLMCVAPFLQPMHGYPHHYFNMTAQGLRTLFDGLERQRIEIYGAMQPLWSLQWQLEAYRDGLPQDERPAFEALTVADLLRPPETHAGEAFVYRLAADARSQLASAHALFATRRPDRETRLRRGGTQFIAWGQDISHDESQAQPPGNSLEALEFAYRCGFDGVELDVQLSRDGVLVLMHDFTLDATTDGTGDVRAHSVAELRTLRLKGSTESAPVRIATLEEALALNADRGYFMCDLRETHDAALAALVEAVDRAAFDARLLLLLAYDVEGGRRLKAALPRAVVLLKLTADPEPAQVPDAAGLDGVLCNCANDLDRLPRLVDAAHANGLRIGVYLHHRGLSRELLREYVHRGVDFVTTQNHHQFGFACS